MKKETKKRGLTRLIEIAGTKKWWLLGSMTLAVLASIAQFVPYLAIFNIVKELGLNINTPELINKADIWFWGKVSLWAIVAFGVLTFTSLILSHIAAFNILYELRMMISKKMPKLPLGFFTVSSSGQLKKVMSEDVERIELFVAHNIPDLTTAFVFPLLVIGYLFTIDWRLALVLLAVIIIAVAFQSSMYLNKNAIASQYKYHEILGKLNASIIEYVRGMQVIKIFNRSAGAFKKLKENILRYRDYVIKVTEFYALPYLGFYNTLSAVLLILIPASILFLIKAPSYTGYLPTVLMFLLLGGGIFFPFLKLMWMTNLLMQNSMGIGLIDNILKQEEIKETENPKMPKDSSIEFKDVSFAYKNNEVLKNITFIAAPGTLTALVGPSGAGKSTIAMLTARFWDIKKGEIKIGGVNIKDIPFSKLMDNISFVFQDNMLFFDTIEENIRMGNKTASKEDVVNAAKAAHCHEFIVNLDKGYDTLVGEGGTYLSGGEAQRVALARVILKNSPILLLDEATAYADPENEGKILKSFSSLIKEKTVIVIAHRLSTITGADQILVVDGGKIKEQGTHEELLLAGGLYKNMWETYSQTRDWRIK
ncbi:ABC-type multidrug transport system [Elusimicrobium minutum Pei191]|uniref:ABC-type multidrug transport system n=1 Tax=Elusimicrobium minutum (strain Pei191) TaxID=445932 RepID=B2KD38_ELUMP|nr:ABC transporter ATP-binding protein [Elusimicrobium minutum]ACC98434.1 ABC-type multidrug transport system [Elusimicrobium minutum Pei191]